VGTFAEETFPPSADARAWDAVFALTKKPHAQMIDILIGVVSEEHTL
jgi:hypothetical protein